MCTQAHQLLSSVSNIPVFSLKHLQVLINPHQSSQVISLSRLASPPPSKWGTMNLTPCFEFFHFFFCTLLPRSVSTGKLSDQQAKAALGSQLYQGSTESLNIERPMDTGKGMGHLNSWQGQMLGWRHRVRGCRYTCSTHSDNRFLLMCHLSLIFWAFARSLWACLCDGRCTLGSEENFFLASLPYEREIKPR